MIGSISTTLEQTFRIDTKEQLLAFFPKDSSYKERFRAKAHQLTHLFTKHTNVTKDKLCAWAAMHPEDHLSKLFEGTPFNTMIVRHEQHMVPKQQGFLEKIATKLSFFVQFIRNPSTVGAFFPSSSALAKAITSKITYDPKAGPRNYLEAGPGTGSFTKKMIKLMRPIDHLTLVECDEHFCEILQQKFGHIQQVTIRHCSITDFEGEKFDNIVAGIPFNSLPAQTVDQIFKKFVELAKPGATLSYFEYQGLPHISKRLPSASHKSNLTAILHTKNSFYSQHGTETHNVTKNAPPATVFHHKIIQSL
jgi:phospholipid N-methyltransferase